MQKLARLVKLIMKLTRRYNKKDLQKAQQMAKHAKTNTDKQAMVLAAQGKPYDHLNISEGFKTYMETEWVQPEGADKLDMDKLKAEAGNAAGSIQQDLGRPSKKKPSKRKK